MRSNWRDPSPPLLREPEEVLPFCVSERCPLPFLLMRLRRLWLIFRREVLRSSRLFYYLVAFEILLTLLSDKSLFFLREFLLRRQWQFFASDAQCSRRHLFSQNIWDLADPGPFDLHINKFTFHLFSHTLSVLIRHLSEFTSSIMPFTGGPLKQHLY